MARYYAKLTREQERALFVQWREQGDRSAYNKIVESQMAWARRKASDFCDRSGWNDRSEARSAAYMGLLKAVERFDISKNYRLSTYAAWWIYQSVSHAYARRKVIHVPCNSRNKPRYAAEAKIANNVASIHSDYRPESFERDPADENLPDLAHLAHTADLTERVQVAMQHLTDRERKVVLLRAKGKAYKEIGKELGISRSRVGQVWVAGMEKLRKICRDGTGDLPPIPRP